MSSAGVLFVFRMASIVCKEPANVIFANTADDVQQAWCASLAEASLNGAAKDELQQATRDVHAHCIRL
jgi:hypothetical protein